MKIKVRICPECRKPYAEPPALSRKDNKTWICPRCGSIQALMDAGYTRKQAEEITDDMRRAWDEYQRNPQNEKTLETVLAERRANA